MNESLPQYAHSMRRRSMRFSLCIALSGALCVLGAGTAWGQLSLTDTNADGVPDLTPVPAFVSAPSSTNLTATFGEALAGVTSGQLVAHGDQQGEITRSASFSGTGSTTLTANPPANLFPGETVFATLTTAITASSGVGLPSGYVWQFTSEVSAASPGVFSRIAA
ncbi:MAG: Ig-like domain-containing protein, partial [Candidatus Latescibacterota bacterium]